MPAIYDSIGTGYNNTRRADPRIISRIIELLDLPSGSRILDIGAGTGSYSHALAKEGFEMTALEPSATMRDQGDDDEHVSWVEASAEMLPFQNKTFDAAILILCIHHFSELKVAFSEIRRVIPSGSPIVIFTYDPEAIDSPWLFDYFPSFRNQIRDLFPSVKIIRDSFDCDEIFSIDSFHLPHDLVDGFAGAAWRYPERYLDQDFRDGTSAFRLLDPTLCKEGLSTLTRDLESGNWDSRYGAVRSMSNYDHGYTFITAR